MNLVYTRRTFSLHKPAAIRSQLHTSWKIASPIRQPATAGADKARYRRRCIYYIASHWSCKTVCVCGGGGGGCARGAAGATFGKYAGGGCDAVLGGPVYACARYIPSSYTCQTR